MREKLWLSRASPMPTPLLLLLLLLLPLPLRVPPLIPMLLLLLERSNAYKTRLSSSRTLPTPVTPLLAAVEVGRTVEKRPDEEEKEDTRMLLVPKLVPLDGATMESSRGRFIRSDDDVEIVPIDAFDKGGTACCCCCCWEKPKLL